MAMGVCGYIEVDGVKYWKPNMASLEGELGRAIIEEIRNAPKPDFDEIAARSRAVEERMLKARAEGTF